jgi:ATP-binding cassette, subfamily A (ABC1), member 3
MNSTYLVYWYLLFPLSNVLVSLFWQILTGWALTSASVFAASLFKSSQLSGVYVVVGFLALALGAMILDSPGPHNKGPKTSVVAAVTLITPSFNYMFAIGYYSRYETSGSPIDLVNAPSGLPPFPDVSTLSALAMWMFLVVQIVLYPALAILTDRLLHGVHFRSRTFDTSQKASDSGLVLQTSGLSKTYVAPWYKRLFQRHGQQAGGVQALQDLDLLCQRKQVLCLLGANGSGKTTTLDLVSGIRSPTSGSVTINASPSQLGLSRALLRACIMQVVAHAVPPFSHDHLMNRITWADFCPISRL